MSTVISFRATDHQLEILDMAEKIIQKPRTEILSALIEQTLKKTLCQMVAAGVKPREFAPPKQRKVNHATVNSR